MNRQDTIPRAVNHAWTATERLKTDDQLFLDAAIRMTQFPCRKHFDTLTRRYNDMEARAESLLIIDAAMLPEHRDELPQINVDSIKSKMALIAGVYRNHHISWKGCACDFDRRKSKLLGL
ncbi:hypothetical protein [Bhargavaea beijingensis]|uniref:Uncharacterized protein n=1 Tax=Bhargavaea beijingensis TaxID=426756 RepID=A0ABX9ZC59_9BACL|nr:hypothetical protein [Bhargavaea beijingensis]RSK30964.1 hypothetical protein EJA12_09615 [Bhargavaea beijingensis]